MMGGYGSGRYGSGTPTTDGRLFLDIRQLRRAGYLEAPAGKMVSYILSWSRGEEPIGKITVMVRGRNAAYPSELVLDYVTQGWGETEWTPVRELVPIETTPCRYGGERPWLRCPRCRSRRAVLFSVAGWFRCRACHGIVYASTRETEDDRMSRRALAIQKRLGGHRYGTIYDPLPKPAGMHWATYARLCAELDELARRSLQRFTERFGSFEQLLKDAPLDDLARAL